MKICSKVYYYKNTGECITITGEHNGLSYTPTIENDIGHIKDIQYKNVEYLELEYGTLERTISKAKSYYVDIETKQLIVEYYKDGETGDNIGDSQLTELELLQNENENLVDEIINLKAENLLLKMEE